MPTAPTNGNSHSSSRSTIPSTISWARLSPEAAWTMLNLALPLSYGISKRELAGRVGESAAWITTQLEALADELEHVGDGR